MKHIIVTRCKFDNENKFNNYLPLIKKYYIQSINNQLDKNFEIGLVSNEKHFNLIRSLVDKNIKMTRFLDIKGDYKDYVIKNNIIIQTRHDCDDFMDKNYIKYIHNLYNINKEKFDKFILNFHPNKLDYKTNNEYKHSRDYSKVCSMFSTLVQKDVKSGIMDVMHDHLSRITRNIIYIDKPYVKLVIHNNNILSRL